MIFYLIPARGGEPKRIEATQDEARTACKARGLRPSEFEKHDVPTDKAKLKDYVNDLLAQAHEMAPGRPQTAAAAVSADEPADDSTGGDASLGRHFPTGTAADGFPEARCAYTPAQVAASALPRSEKVQDVCHLIAKMPAGELGFVALEVIARGARLSGLAQ